MQRVFDCIVVGSGPTAVAALINLRNQNFKNIAVITGETDAFDAANHPKIRSESFEAGAPAYVKNIVNGAHGESLYASAQIGGFANFWGQQAARYLASEPWEAAGFSSFTQYEDYCRQIEDLFTITQAKTYNQSSTSNKHKILLQTPRLIIGDRANPNLQLRSIKTVFESLATATGSIKITDRVRKIEPHGSVSQILTEKNLKFEAERIILAAGILGNAKILLNSSNEISKAQFLDHSPLTVFSFPKRLKGSIIRAPGNFNGSTLKVFNDKEIICYGSIYTLAEAKISLALSMLGMPPALRGWRLKYIPNMVTPFQLWLKNNNKLIEIDKLKNQATSIELASEKQCAMYREILSATGYATLFTKRSTAGSGFHYHNLQLNLGRGRFHPINDVLHELFPKNAVVCVDGSSIKKIGVSPPTLSFMASALRRTETMF